MAADDAPGRSGSVFPGFDAIAPDAERIIQELVRRRRELRVSQTAVAARMGTSQSAVARLEAGRSDARLSTLERYAEALGVSLSYGLSERPADPGAGGRAPDGGGGA